MNKQINLIINGKGGVGKSFFAANFVQYLKDCGIAHCAIDSDHENSTLKRFHPQSEFINLEHRREIDRVFTTAETSDLLVIDCRAASTDLFIDFFDEVNFAEVLRSLGARLTVICPVNHEADSVEQLRIFNDPAASPPSFEDFRGTIELLDRRSKAFIHQAADLVGELRRFGHNVNRINRARFITHCVCAAVGAVAGVLIDRLL